METKASAPSVRSYYVRKLFRFFGLVPLTIYVVAHLYNNNISWQGAEAFNAHLASWRAMPYIVPLTILFLYMPLFWHLFVGIKIATETKPNNIRYGYFSNLKYLLQRLSGIGLALFIPAHIFKVKIEPIIENEIVDFKHMAEGLSEHLTFAVYMLGILGVAYHVANGLWEASITWGWTANRKSQKAMVGVSMIVFLALGFLGFNAVRGFLQ